MARGASQQQTEVELLHEISHKLDMLMGSIAIQNKDARTQVRILTKLGLSGPEIGALLDKNPDAVRQLRARREK